MATLGKLWGFLKYYHPSVLRGKPDWDKELCKMIPMIEKATTDQSVDSLLEEWYRSLPVARVAASPVDWSADSLKRTFTEKDIRQFAVSNWLKNEMTRLYQFHIPDTSRYVTRYYSGHVFDHIIHTENRYDTPAYPVREMRLLTLFRYWNTIEYFYPHKHRIAAWDEVLNNYITRFLLAKDSFEYRIAVRELIHELPDSHSFIQLPGETFYFYPFRLDYIQGKYVIGQCDSIIAKENDYRLGDEVIAINGKKTAERGRDLLQTTTGTNALSRYRNVAQNLLKMGDSVVQVSFKREGRIISKKIPLHTWPVYSQLKRAPAQPLWKEVEKGIWYVRFCAITKPDTLRALFHDIRRAKTVIWDMRAYPNYMVTTLLYQYLFTSKTLLEQDRSASAFFPGSFIESPNYFMPAVDTSVPVYTGAMIVLVDENTQSLSESVSAALRLRPNTIVAGRQTAGTTGNITWLGLPGDIVVSYTGVGVIGEQESFRQGEGVKVDIPVKLTVERVRSSKDYILEQAIKHARKM